LEKVVDVESILLVEDKLAMFKTEVVAVVEELKTNEF